MQKLRMMSTTTTHNTNVVAEQPQEQLQAYPIAPTPERSSTAQGVTMLNSPATPEILFGTLKPTGSTIIINGGTNGSSLPLFAWRVTPFIPTLVPSAAHMDKIATATVTKTSTAWEAHTIADRVAFHHPFTPLSDMETHYPAKGTGTLKNGVFPTRGICCHQYGEEPLFSRWARSHRGWRGTICYAFRMVANFTSQAYFRIMVVNGRPKARVYDSKIPISVLPAYCRLLNGVSDFASNGWVRIDASEKKHFNIEVPYERLQRYEDEHQKSVTYSTRDYNTEQFIVVQIAGQFTSQSNAQIQIEVEYGPGADFKLYKPIGPWWIFSYAADLVTDYGETDSKGVIWKRFRDARRVSYIIGDHDVAPSTWPRARWDETVELVINNTTYTLVAGIESSLRLTDDVNKLIISPYDQGAPTKAEAVKDINRRKPLFLNDAH